MIIIDTSAWIEFFKPNGNENIKRIIRYALNNETVSIGDLIYCELLQGVKTNKELVTIKALFSGIKKNEMVGFKLADKSAYNYRYLRSKGIIVRKTIDILIATFCIENKFKLIYFDSDFDYIQKNLPLDIFTL